MVCGCQGKCQGDIVALADGSTACTYSRRYLLECEARYLLDMPLNRRRAALLKRQILRGETATNELKDAIIAVHAARKAGNG